MRYAVTKVSDACTAMQHRMACASAASASLVPQLLEESHVVLLAPISIAARPLALELADLVERALELLHKRRHVPEEIAGRKRRQVLPKVLGQSPAPKCGARQRTCHCATAQRRGKLLQLRATISGVCARGSRLDWLLPESFFHQRQLGCNLVQLRACSVVEARHDLRDKAKHSIGPHASVAMRRGATQPCAR